MKKLVTTALAMGCSTAAVLACGTPPEPPPPPPDPPIVCCFVIDWWIDPADPGFEYLTVRYVRDDGLPLFQSNPMPLPPTQQCACALPPLPQSAAAAGVQVVGLSFGDILPSWQGLPPDVPGYGPFEPIDPTDNTQFQVDSFFDIYYQLGGIPIPPAGERLSSVFQFGGPGDIPPGQVFDVYQLLRIPAGFDPNQLCLPQQLGGLGLFLVDNGQVFVEPPAPGAPPLNLAQFAANGGNAAFYKFRWYPLHVPPPCPIIIGPNPCPWDFNGDGNVGAADLAQLLGAWGFCP